MKTIHAHHRQKKRFYIPLTIVKSRQSPTSERNPDEKGITIGNILESTNGNDIIVIQGDGGVGKTFMMETAALHWAQGRIWQNIDFVFLLKFRELNFYRNLTLDEVVQKMYKFMINQNGEKLFSEKHHSIVYLFDGLDEFANEGFVNSANSCGSTSLTESITTLLNPICTFQDRRIVIISSRRTASDRLKSSFKLWSISTFEILGFNRSQVNQYIQRYFSENSEIRRYLEITIQTTNGLNAMSQVPAFLWSLCELYQEDRRFADIKTTTELFVWQFSIFLKQHYKMLNSTIGEDDFVDKYKLAEVQELVFSLAELAKDMLEKGVSLIPASSIPDRINIEGLEKSGIVSQIQTSDGEKIQFHHKFTQEFLAAIFYQKQIPSDDQLDELIKFFSHEQMQECFQFFAGLRGGSLENSTSPVIITTFVRNLNISSQRLPNSYHVPDIGLMTSEYFLEILYEYQNVFILKLYKEIRLIRKSRNKPCHLLYFFQNFEGKFNPKIELLETGREGRLTLLSEEEIEVIKSNICKIKAIWISWLNAYDKKDLRSLMKAAVNCKKESMLENIVYDYHPLHSDSEYLDATEILLRNIHQFTRANILGHSNNLRFLTLILKTLDGNKYSKKFKLKTFIWIPASFNLKYCNVLLDIINVNVLENIHVLRFPHIIFDEIKIEICKEKITNSLQMQNSSLKIMELLHWKISYNISTGLWDSIYEPPELNESTDKIQIFDLEEKYALSQCLYANCLLFNSGVLTILFCNSFSDITITKIPIIAIGITPIIVFVIILYKLNMAMLGMEPFHCASSDLLDLFICHQFSSTFNVCLIYHICSLFFMCYVLL